MLLLKNLVIGNLILHIINNKWWIILMINQINIKYFDILYIIDKIYR